MDSFKAHRGCFSALIRAFLLIYAILSLLVGEDIFIAWLIIIGEAIDLLLRILYHGITTRKSKYYKKEESYWYQRAEEAKKGKQNH